MQIASWRVQIVAAWFLTIVLVGYFAEMTSARGWVLLAAVALTLPAIILRFWRRPEPSMSESIHDAR
jgi:hypothetical protein